MNMDTLLRKMDEADRAQTWDDGGHTAVARYRVYGGIAALALLLLLLALWLTGRGDGGGADPLGAPAALAQPTNVPVGSTGTNAGDSTKAGGSTGGGVTTTAKGHGSRTVHAGGTGGGAARRPGTSGDSPSSGSTGAGDATGTPDMVAMGLGSSGMMPDGSVKRVDVTSCTNTGGRAAPTGTVTFGNGLVVHGVPVNGRGSTVTVGGVQYTVPAGATYGLGTCT